MSYNNPISAEAVRPDVGLDMVLNSLVQEFNDLIWLDGKVFLRAYDFRQESAIGEVTTEPQVYMGNGEYYRVLYNDNLPFSLFFRTEGDETIGLDKILKPKIINYSRPLSLIFWGNLKRIQRSYSGDYIFTESIKREFMTVLAKNQYVRTVTAFIDDPIEKIFEGYTISNEKRHLAKYPYVAFKITFTVEYKTGLIPC